MSTKAITVLFLCTGNSARSIIAEAVMNKEGRGRFKAYSAGCDPVGSVNPYALELLEAEGCAVGGLRSKSWDEFSEATGPSMEFICTVCDNAADEVCPVWPGAPISIHWGIADPAAVLGDGAAKRAAFRAAFDEIRRGLDAFMDCPLDSLDRAGIHRPLGALGKAAV